MRIALSEMSDEELLKNHFESGEEMIKRNMVGAEIWKTGDGVVTNGTGEAREAILNIYRDPESGFQQLLDECSAKAAKTSTHNTQSNPTLGPFAVSQPPKLDRPLSMLNERQLASYSVVLLNHQRLVAGHKKKRIEWGNEEEKPDHHPDNILNWVDLTKSPGNMSAAEFMNICKEDPIMFPIAPFKPQKTDFYRQLIENTLTSIGIDPEKHFDKTVFTVKKEKDLSKGLANRTKHRLPVLPSRGQQASTPVNTSLNRRSSSTGSARVTRRSLSVASTTSTPRPSFIPSDTSSNPPEVPSFDGDTTQPTCEYENIRASNIAEREEMFRRLDIAGALQATKQARL